MRHKKECFEIRMTELVVIVFTRSCTANKLASSADSIENIFSVHAMKTYGGVKVPLHSF